MKHRKTSKKCKKESKKCKKNFLFVRLEPMTFQKIQSFMQKPQVFIQKLVKRVKPQSGLPLAPSSLPG